MIGWTPHESQPQPKARGSAKVGPLCGHDNFLVDLNQGCLYTSCGFVVEVEVEVEAICVMDDVGCRRR